MKSLLAAVISQTAQGHLKIIGSGHFRMEKYFYAFPFKAGAVTFSLQPTCPFLKSPSKSVIMTNNILIYKAHAAFSWPHFTLNPSWAW